MKKFISVSVAVIALIVLTLGCGPAPTPAPTATPAEKVDSPPPTQPAEPAERCGDGVCDAVEQKNPQLCPQDCPPPPTEPAQAVAEPTLPPPTPTPAEPTPLPEATQEASPEEQAEEAGYGILYHVVEHTVASHEMSGATCYTFTFRRYLDGGYVQPDGRGNEVLDLKDYPTSLIAAKEYDDYYYISSPTNPVYENYGLEMFDWDVEGQTLWAAEFATNRPVEIAKSVGDRFPGGVQVSPENAYLLYPFTQRSGTDGGQSGGFMVNKFNPFASDSSLVVVNTATGAETTLLADSYNRQLFTSFAGFAPGGDSFYTIAREGDSFAFVKISLESGQVTGFDQVFPAFDWGQVNWDEFFPRADDFAYASFAISPDETRLIAYKNVFTANLDNPCFSEARHHLWVFHLEENRLEVFRDRPGYVSDADWNADSSAFVLAAMGHSGCYPDYLDARVEVLDRDGQNGDTLVNEAKSKITNLGWSPDGRFIVYDVYATDFVGRLKVIDVDSRQVSEIISTQDLGHSVSQSNPVTFLFADWVSATGQTPSSEVEAAPAEG